MLQIFRGRIMFKRLRSYKVEKLKQELYGVMFDYRLKEIREYFAGLALQGMWANSNFLERTIEHTKTDIYEEYAKCAVQCADALIKELEKCKSVN